MQTILTVISLLVVSTVLAHAQQLEYSNPDGLTKPPTYSQVVKAGKLLFIAGQVGNRADGNVVGPGMKEQLDQALTNLGTALKAHGADFGRITKITIFVTSIAEFQADEVRAVRTKHFGNNKPASTLVQIVQLAQPAYKVEVEAIAVLP